MMKCLCGMFSERISALMAQIQLILLSPPHSSICYPYEDLQAQSGHPAHRTSRTNGHGQRAAFLRGS